MRQAHHYVFALGGLLESLQQRTTHSERWGVSTNAGAQCTLVAHGQLHVYAEWGDAGQNACGAVGWGIVDERGTQGHNASRASMQKGVLGGLGVRAHIISLSDKQIGEMVLQWQVTTRSIYPPGERQGSGHGRGWPTGCVQPACQGTRSCWCECLAARRPSSVSDRDPKPQETS